MGTCLFLRTNTWIASLRYHTGDHTGRIKYSLLMVVFLAFVLQYNVSTLYLKTELWLFQLTKQVAAKCGENSAEVHE